MWIVLNQKMRKRVSEKAWPGGGMSNCQKMRKLVANTRFEASKNEIGLMIWGFKSINGAIKQAGVQRKKK